MEYLEGYTLREMLRAKRPIKYYDFIAITNALIELKASGQMDAHRDLKPENIIIGDNNTVKLIDPSPHPDDFNQTFVTSPHYYPLLQKDSKADVMAIGIMLYEVCTTVLPFDKVPYCPETSQSIKFDSFDLSLSYFLSYPPVRDLNPSAPKLLEEVIRRSITDSSYGLKELQKELIRLNENH
jgi:serine/threonine protein kinase